MTTDSTLFSTKQAAEYLDMPLRTIRYHIHEAHTLSGQKIGNSLVFSKAELDQFLANKRPQGRPKKETK